MAFIAQRGRSAGQWWPTVKKRLTDFSVEQVSAVFHCPHCSRPMDLQKHIIASSGEVMPSVVEPQNPIPKCANTSCGFHETLTLDGWNAAAIAAEATQF